MEEELGGCFTVAGGFVKSKIWRSGKWNWSIWIWLLGHARLETGELIENIGDKGYLTTSLSEISKGVACRSGKEKPSRETVKKALNWFEQEGLLSQEQLDQEIRISLVNPASYPP